jgi:G3E family GTPase
MEFEPGLVQPEPAASVPVTIIAGFLGSGKTTLLNHILSENHGVRAAVLVNDFGAINIDAKMIVGVEGDTITLENGCICCNVRDDLFSACLSLLRRPDPPERLIIETSGVSDPARVAETFFRPEIYRYLTMDNVLSVVDAEQFPALLDGEMAELARVQIHVADIVVLNKVDLVEPDGLDAVKNLVREITPGSRMLEVTFGRIPLELALDTSDWGPGARPLETRRESAHEGANHEDHGEQFSRWHWTCDQPLSLPKLRAVLDSLPNTVFRAKGIVYLEELPTHRIAMQMVGKRYELSDTVPWESEAPRSEIVLIASHDGFNAESLTRSFEDCVGTGDESQSPVLRLARRLEIADNPS